jgi:hypothetical protein
MNVPQVSKSERAALINLLAQVQKGEIELHEAVGPAAAIGFEFAEGFGAGPSDGDLPVPVLPGAAEATSWFQLFETSPEHVARGAAPFRLYMGPAGQLRVYDLWREYYLRDPEAVG